MGEVLKLVTPDEVSKKKRKKIFACFAKKINFKTFLS